MNQHFEKGTFNTVSYGNTGSFGGSFPVWARIENRLVSGGYFDLTTGNNPLTGKAWAAGDIIPAGTMVEYPGPGGKLTIVPNFADSADNAETLVANVKGLVDNDVVIPANCKLATAAVVVKGRIYADRVKAGNVQGLPKAVEAKLPMIEFVREA